MAEDDSGLRVVIVVPNEERRAEGEAALALLPSRSGLGVGFEVHGGDPAGAIGAARQLHGRGPIGYLADDEAEAELALLAGADEALAVHGDDADTLSRLLARVIIRSRARMQQEQLQATVAHSEKLAALGTAVAGVAHEINNPAGVVVLGVESLRAVVDGLDPAVADDAREILDDMKMAIRTITDVVRDLRVFARDGADEEPQLVQVHDIVDQVLRMVGREISVRGHIERDYSPDMPRVWVARGRLTQVLTNVIINAGQALREVDRPMHRVRISTRADDDSVAISVLDTGPGIPAALLEKIFDPFFTTKGPGLGTGLGLSLSREIVRQMGGDIVAESRPGEGASFVILLPRPQKTLLHVVSEVTPTKPKKARRHAVLVVDDDDKLLRGYARLLRERYDVLLASDGQEAIDLLQSGSHADAVLCDIQMPEIDGIALHRYLRKERPLLAGRTVFATARVRDQEAEYLRETGCPVLEKPVHRDVLLRALDDALDGSPEQLTPQAVVDPSVRLIVATTGTDKQKVLVVDDIPIVRRSIERVLRAQGFDVEGASSGVEALALLLEKAYDVIVSDFAMSGMSGGELAVAAKKVRPQTPFVVLSGASRAEVGRALDALGAEATYLAKPPETAALVATIGLALLGVAR